MRNVSFNIAKCVLLLWAAIVLHEGQAQSQPKSQVVQLGSASPQFSHVFDNPLKVLAIAAERDRTSPRFRVTWGGNLGSSWNQGTMLFDRKRHLLKYYDVGGSGEAGERYYRKSYVFLGIKNTTLTNIVKIYNNEQNIRKLYPSSFINLLPKHGYRRYKLADLEVIKEDKK